MVNVPLIPNEDTIQSLFFYGSSRIRYDLLSEIIGKM